MSKLRGGSAIPESFRFHVRNAHGYSSIPPPNYRHSVAAVAVGVGFSVFNRKAENSPPHATAGHFGPLRRPENAASYMPASRIRTLIADNSVFVRTVFNNALGRPSSFEVIASDRRLNVSPPPFLFSAFYFPLFLLLPRFGVSAFRRFGVSEFRHPPFPCHAPTHRRTSWSIGPGMESFR